MFGILFGVKHPKTLDDTKKPGKPALILGLIAIFILIVSSINHTVNTLDRSSRSVNSSFAKYVFTNE